ncbi:MAG: CarD family transcriptional regulator [Oscillibacter sp.]|jgi:CarD family transcriptional regulator|nr:CarD family transcriptional regulator [Oscillibacter sp.]
MYQNGDLVVYGSTGVCKVEGLGSPDYRGVDRERKYYLLNPLYQDGVIYTPVDGGKVPIRPVMSADDAHKLIDLIPSVHAEACHERTLQLLAQKYQTALQSGDSRDLLKLTMSVHVKRKQAEKQNHRLGMVDEKYGKQAERLLFGELAVALDIPFEQVPTYIASRVNDEETLSVG